MSQSLNDALNTFAEKYSSPVVRQIFIELRERQIKLEHMYDIVERETFRMNKRRLELKDIYALDPYMTNSTNTYGGFGSSCENLRGGAVSQHLKMTLDVGQLERELTALIEELQKKADKSEDSLFVLQSAFANRVEQVQELQRNLRQSLIYCLDSLARVEKTRLDKLVEKFKCYL